MLPPLVTLQHCLTVICLDAEPIQFRSSPKITVTLYVPLDVTSIDCVVAPVLQVYDKPAGLAVNVAGPDARQCVDGPLMVTVPGTQGAHSCIAPLLLAVHPFESVTVTLKFPASHNPLIDDVVAPVFHTYEYAGVPPFAFADTLAEQAYNN